MPANLDGKMVMTNSQGEYTVDVPIGSHFISVEKSGHSFVNGGRFPANELEKYNFQTSLSNINFKDLTTVRIVGRVVGGQPQTDKELGFGLSESNIGKATIKLSTVNNVYRLNMNDQDSVIYNTIDGKESITTFKQALAGSEIEIETNPITGEFVTDLPPVQYNVLGVKTKDFEDTGADTDVVDFSYSKRTFDINPILEQTIEYTDSLGIVHRFQTHDSLRITRYNEPELIVRDLENNDGAFGEKTYTYIEEGTGRKEELELYTINPDGTVTYTLGAPVFNQDAGQYNWEVSAFERYVNHDDEANPWEETVPLAEVEININNGLSSLRVDIDTTQLNNPTTLTASQKVLLLDEKGKSKYSFMTGFPNINGDNKLAAKLSFEKNGKTISWEMDGYMLGFVPSDGNNFVTKGPDYVDIVLNDPPGSNSYAYIEKGSSYSTTQTRTDEVHATESFKATIMPCKKMTSGTGFGVFLIEDASVYGDIELGTEIEERTGKNWERTNTTTFSQRIQTSGDPNYVGSMADVFIGKSTNITFGKVRNLTFFPDPNQGIPLGNTGYSLYTKETTQANMEFDTNFIFTQEYIINTLIPNLRSLRNSLLITVSSIPSESSLNFGTKERLYYTTLPESDPEFGNPETYHIFFRPNLVENKQIDEILLYNSSIQTWEKRIEENEKAKVDLFAQRDRLETERDAKVFENISYDAGTSLEKDVEVAYEEVYMKTSSVDASGSVGGNTGFLLSRCGFVFEAEVKVGRNQENGEGSGVSESVKFGYVLSEDESVLFAGKDALTIDVYGPSNDRMRNLVNDPNNELHHLSGFTFRTRAGQTSCPHEPGDHTLYYMDDQGDPLLLNYGTFQIEKPELYIDNKKHSTAENIPAGRAATFTLQLQNNSDANLDVTYKIYVDPASNPDGLILEMDGEPLVTDRQIRIKYGEEVTKNLKVRQSSLDILEYDSVVIRLGSVCDIDSYVEASLGVKFTPSSSPVSLTASTRLANRKALDEGGKINFVISDYERNFKNFGCIRLEYKLESSDIWIPIREFVNDDTLFPITSSEQELITGSTISYDYYYNEIEPADGTYLFRAVSISKIGYEEVSFASDEIRVVKDVRAPQLLGNASPVNGILAVGDEISLTFSEDIQSGLLTSDKFSITGILNADIRIEPTVGLAFTGIENAHTELPINTGGSFTIESWFRRPGNTAGTLFSYGEGNNHISLSFDAAGHAVVKIGDEVKTSTKTIQASEVWKYAGLSYNRAAGTVSVYVIEEPTTIDMFIDMAFTQEPSTQGKLYIGNNSAGNSGLIGSVALLHFYNINRTSTDAEASKYEVKSGNEPNLIGHWELEEGEGKIAKDKARSRHLTLNTDWYIYPRGKSLTLNGASDYARIPSGTFPFRSYDDFTWEFWFKAPQQGAATLLSCGLTAYIGFDNDHKLILTTGKGNTYVLCNDNLLDDQWHHFALSVKRNGMLRALVDGAATASISSNLFEGSVGGGYYYLGAKYTEPEGMTMQTSEYFKGNIDELRVWGAALTTEAILLDKNSKLRGTEAGLKAYYPFESYQKRDQLIEVYESLNDVVTPTNKVENMTSTSNVAAPMKDARPVKEVPFSFAASERKVVLTITEEEYRIDNVVLKITADKVLDMNNNPSNAFAWTAYVNRSPLNWGADAVDILMEYGDIRSFKTMISNNAGTITDYYIDGLPSWLTVSSTSGSLQPLATKELTFTVAPDVNIGSYEAAISLTGVNNVSKILPVTLKVTGVQPDWMVNLNDFEQTMTVTGQVQIAGVVQEDEDDILAAFINDRCIGIASPQYEPSYNSYFVYMMIGGDDEHDGKEISFKLWDASTGNTYPVLEQSRVGSPINILFTGDDVQGSPDQPICFNALNVIEQSIALNKGWNWISVNVQNNNPSLIDQLKENTVHLASQIKAGDGKFLNNVEDEWIGLITDIDTEHMYTLKADGNESIRIVGQPVKPGETSITLLPNRWSWIAYSPQFTLPVKDALAGISDPMLNDQVKGQRGYRIMSSQGWIGSLSSMEPGRGYKYKSGNNQEVVFHYPTTSAVLRSPMKNSTHKPYEYRWNVDCSRFDYNMTVTASLFIEDEEITSGLYEVAAFSGDECRGSAIMEYVEGFDHPFMNFLMVYGEKSERIEFRIFNHATGEIHKAKEVLVFTPDAIHGTPDELFALTVYTPTGINSGQASVLSLYPNPVEKELFINHNLGTLDKIEISDISGKQLLIKDNFDQPSVDVSSFSKGTYLVRIISGEYNSVHKFIKK
ncbi:T9SS type A sorting domain-containing protein [Bacteroidales bacterium OttesenSCG-928-M11]|nr:T9SS type A sorting domain-containing protein [Bacteroidales bacterium OttesenSCG-928-M11]